jgi:hypothetical protein
MPVMTLSLEDVRRVGVDGAELRDRRSSPTRHLAALGVQRHQRAVGLLQETLPSA